MNQVKNELFRKELDEKINIIKERYDEKEKSLDQSKENALLKQKNDLDKKYREREEKRIKGTELNIAILVTLLSDVPFMTIINLVPFIAGNVTSALELNIANYLDNNYVIDSKWEYIYGNIGGTEEYCFNVK